MAETPEPIAYSLAGPEKGERIDRADAQVVKAVCHSCNDPSKPIAGIRPFEADDVVHFPVCAECMEGIDTYGEPE